MPLQREVINDTTTTSFASFDMSGGPVRVTITCRDAVQSAKLLPLSYGITPVVSGKTITFEVEKPGQMTLEINGNWISSLHLFANPMETNIPDPKDPNVIYYGPGIHPVRTIDVTSGKTVYIADGAVVYGHFEPGDKEWTPIFNLHGSNIVLRGRGIIDGSLCPHFRPTMGECGDHIQVEGVIVRDSCQFAMPVRKSNDVKISNVKIFGWRGNSDGIDVCNSRQVEISDCFLRTFDDLIVMKTDLGQGELRNVIVSIAFSGTNLPMR